MSDTQVNVYTTSSQNKAAVAVDGDGDLVVVWQSSGQDTSGYGVYARRYDASGVAQGSEFLVNTTILNNQTNADIAMDAAGNFVVTWDSNGQDGSGVGIYAQRYDASGAAQGSEFRVNSYTSNNQSLSAVAMDADGDFVVAWGSSGQDGSSYGIYVQRYNAAGVAQGSEFLVNSYTTGLQGVAAAAMDADGDFVVTWTSNAQDGDGNGVYAQRYNASGVAQGSEFQVNTYTTSAQTSSAVAMDADGDFVVAWQSSGQDGVGHGIYAQRYDAAGVAQGGEFLVNTYTTSTQNTPSVAIDADGDFIIAWQSGGQDGANYGIYAQRFSAAGVAVGDEFRVNTTTAGTQQRADIAPQPDGDAVVIWDGAGDPNESQDGVGVFLAIAAAVTNVAPVLTGDLAATLDEGADHTLTGGDLGFSDADDVAGGITFQVSGLVAGVIRVAGATATSFTGTQLAAGEVVFRHDGSETGAAAFDVTVEDGDEDASAPVAQTFDLTVTPVDDPAVAVDDTFATTESGAVGTGLNVFDANGGAADSDPDNALTVTAVSGGTLGTEFALASGALLTLNADGSFAYDPNGAFDLLPDAASGAANASATDSFSYFVTGGAMATVTIAIAGETSDLDLLLGTAGDDTVTGGAFRDRFQGSLGADTLDGAGGVDYVRYGDSSTGVTIDLTTNLNLGGDAEGDTLISIDHIGGSSHADDLTGNAGANQIEGGAGADRMAGLAGSDTYYVDDAGDVVIEDAAAGADTVIATIDHVLGDHVERLALRGTDDLDGTGNGLANVLTGNDGANILRALGGNDALLGGEGDDTLDGGEGSDRLTGGAGADLFVFAAASNTRNGVWRDRILDFETGIDRIDLSAIDADIRIGAPGDQAFGWLGGARFTGAAHEIRSQTIFGQTIIQGDIDGDKRTDFEIMVQGVTGPLTVDDFVL